MSNEQARLSLLVEEMNRDEARVALRFLERWMGEGRDSYGPLNLSEPRNWKCERREEGIDWVFYDICDELVAEDGMNEQEQHTD